MLSNDKLIISVTEKIPFPCKMSLMASALSSTRSNTWLNTLDYKEGCFKSLDGAIGFLSSIKVASLSDSGRGVDAGLDLLIFEICYLKK